MENSGSLQRPRCHSIESILGIGPSLVEGNTTKKLQPLKTSCHLVELLSSHQERRKIITFIHTNILYSLICELSILHFTILLLP